MATKEGTTSKRQGSDLEKFKRRMIRSVARRIKEKIPEDQLWEEMKKEIGSNCKKLWTRMRMLTLKKLRRLLEVDDRVDLIGPVARMTLTDWLLFDLVIVHEKIDVIDRDKLTADYKSNVLTNLFSLVQLFEIEGRSGDNLVEAWTAATVYYNSKGHQCSPMMLQRRWYQLKEMTRHKFYKFWFCYRGNQRQLAAAKQHSPDELQKAIALRYPQIITQKFLTWEEGIEKRLIILPDELGVKMRQRNLMKPSDTSVPDVVLIEPQVETIDLGSVSDSEENGEEIAETNIQPVVNVKNEPVDIDDTQFQIPPEKGSEFDEEIQRLQMVEENLDEASAYANTDENIDAGQDISDINNEIFSAMENDGAILIDDEDDTYPQNNVFEENVMNHEEKANNKGTNIIAEISSVTSIGVKVENVDDVIERHPTDDIAVMLPVISTVSSAGIKVEPEMDIATTTCENDTNQSDITEALPVISTISSKGMKVEIEIERKDELEGISATNATDGPRNSTDVKEEKDLDEFDDINMDFNIADEGIDFADDGIAYIEDDEDDIITQKDPPETDKVKTEISNHSDEENEDKDRKESEESTDDTQKFDLKLLMYPVVYTTKLDAMPVFNDVSKYIQVLDKETIDKIYSLSKPYSKQSVNTSEVIKKEKTYTSDVNTAQVERSFTVGSYDSFQNESVESDTEHESDRVDDNKRVKLSSYMLQKPKRRSYNPVILCKNPDFNTRLKKLSVGFFMSTRNRTLLQSCIPVTIDMSKAFEDKLIDGTLYLKPTPIDEKCDKQNDISFDVTSAALVKPTTVQQSLMNIDDTLEIELKKRMAERVRAINLPDISQVRRLNQHLLTAEVNPIRLQEAQGKSKQNKLIGPACYIQNIKDDINNLLLQQKVTDKPDAIVIDKPSPQVSVPETTPPMVTINNPIIEATPQTNLPSRVTNKNTQQTEEPKLTTSELTKTRKRYKKSAYPTLAWNCRPYLINQTTQEIHQTDSLLTIDTLYKMLSALDPNLKKNSLNHKQKKKAIEDSNENKTTRIDSTLIDITGDETTPAESKKSKKQENVSSTKVCLKDREFCCWYSYKFGNNKIKSKRKHKCKIDECKCCCKHIFVASRVLSETEQVDMTSSEQPVISYQNIQQTIESVVNQANPEKQLSEASVQIDLDDDTEVTGAVTDISLTTAVLTRTADAVVDTTPNSSNDATAELTPLPSTILPKFRVYTARPKIKNKPDQNIITPLEDNTVKPVSETIAEPKKRFVRRVFSSRNTLQNKISTLQNKAVPSRAEICTCRPQISNVNQGLIEINGKNNCVIHKSEIKDKKNITNKLLPSGDLHQFFIGKDKILLTNVKMPSSDDSKSVTPIVEKTVEPTEVQTFRLPAGVQIVLLPDQTLTYVIQPNVTLTSEEYDMLPQFLAAIQQQINASGITLPTSHTVPKINEKDGVIILDDEKSPDERDTVQNEMKDTNVDISSGEPIAIPEDKSADETPKNEDSEKSTDKHLTEPNDATTETKENVKLTPEKNNEMNSANTQSETETSDSVINDPAERDSSSENNQPKSSVDDTANKKSLLSDLMEMSGIMEEDLAPAPPVIATTQEPIILDTQNFVLQREVPQEHVTQTVELPQAKKQYTAVNKEGTFELHAISSFAELKYACDNNGLFFKLDLDTGSLTSINVCIKKYPVKAKRTVSMIDLTDDPDDPDSVAGTSECDAAANKHSVFMNEVHEQSPPKIQITSILQKKRRLMERLSNNLKPVNIQQSKRHVARILKGNQSWKNPEFPSYKNKIDKIETKIDLVDSDAPMEEEYLVNSDDSSDDEPLIKKVKQKSGEEPTSVSDEHSQDEQNESQIVGNEQPNSEGGQSVSQPNELPVSETNEMSVDEEDRETSEHNEQEEYLERYESEDEAQNDVTPMPVPTNLLLSGGALNAHNIPLNCTYRDSDESQDEDCILGV